VKPQCRDILRLLERGPVTQQDAIREAACYRLAARVADLRAEGYPIESELVTQRGVRFARYRLAPKVEQLVVGL
jgi:hypothetical protein